MRKFFKKIKTFFSDHYHILFKSAADNHLRIQNILKQADGTYQLTVNFGSYTELKNYQKKVRRLTVSLSSAVAMVVVAFIVSPYILNPNKSAASTFSWAQSKWGGTAGTNGLTAATQSGWNGYQAKDSSNNLAVSDTAITLTTPTVNSTSDTTYQSVETTTAYPAFYHADANGNYSASGTMLALKKPQDATCAVDGECANNFCYNNNVCLAPCSANVVAGGKCVFNGTAYGVVAAGGALWLDRNLGATKGALSIGNVSAVSSATDSTGFGWLFQWGRLADGHQIRTSLTTAARPGVDNPYPSGNGLFILAGSHIDGWRNPFNTNLWQGLNGINNPCPPGFRIPTYSELNSAATFTNITTAFSSPLKLTATGYRDKFSGALTSTDTAWYWSSNFYYNWSPQDAMYYYDINVVAAAPTWGGNTSLNSASGAAVRCIKN